MASAIRQSDGTYQNEYGQTSDAYGNVINATTSPGTQTGSGTYGAVAGATATPNVYGDLASVYPNLGKTQGTASGNILSELQGNLSSGTINAIQDAAARFGINSGMGSSGLSHNLSLRDLGLTSENVQQQGLTDFNNLLGTVSKTETVSPETQIALSQSNNALAAQANPQDATNYALSLYNQYLNTLSGAGSKTSGVTTPTIRGNSGGSGTTQPFQSTAPTVTTPGAPGGGSSVGTGSTGGYEPVTGNTYGGFSPTDTGATPDQSEFNWEAMLSAYGL